MFKKKSFWFAMAVILITAVIYGYWYFPPFQGHPATLDQLRVKYQAAAAAFHILPQIEQESRPGIISRDEELATLRDRLINAKVHSLTSSSVEMRSLNTRLVTYTEDCREQAELIRATKCEVRKNLDEARALRIGVWAYLARLERVRNPKLANTLARVALARSDKQENQALSPIYNQLLDDETSHISEGARVALRESLYGVKNAWQTVNKHQTNQWTSRDDGIPDYGKATDEAAEVLRYAETAQREIAINTLNRRKAAQWLDSKTGRQSRAAALLLTQK